MKVGGSIGIMNTIGIIIGTGILGATLSRHQGRQVIGELTRMIGEGREPTQLLIEGVLVFVGGVLLLTPGFFTDGVGFLMILPGTRRLFVSTAKSYFASGVRSGRFKVYTQTTQSRNNRDYEAENKNPGVIDVDGERLE